MFAPDCVRELHSAQTSISGQHAGSEIFEQKRMSHFDNIAALLQLQLLCADGPCKERGGISMPFGNHACSFLRKQHRALCRRLYCTHILCNYCYCTHVMCKAFHCAHMRIGFNSTHVLCIYNDNDADTKPKQPLPLGSNCTAHPRTPCLHQTLL